MRQMLYKPEFVGSFISLVRRVKSMQMNWMTIVAIIVIVVAVGFLLMRRKSS
jgi:LPXTG-motif cell wall-anchored protein